MTIAKVWCCAIPLSGDALSAEGAIAQHAPENDSLSPNARFVGGEGWGEGVWT